MSALEPLPLEPLIDDNPLVSVLIPNKDYGRFLPDALDGLLAQTYGGWEAVVCDDGSTDDSRDVVRAYAARDARISLVEHRSTRGQGAAFNSAFDACRGEIVCLLDADDVFHPAKIAAAVDTFRRSGAGVVVHPLMLTDADGRAIQRIPGLTEFERGWIAERVLRRGGRWRWVPSSGVTLRREIAELVFPMPEEGYVSSADTFLLMLAPLLTSVEVVDEVLARYRRHGGNHFARVRFDVGRIPRTRANLELSVERVNDRLDALGCSGARLHVADNLMFAELGFQQALFSQDTTRSELLGRFRVLMARVDRDDLYGDLQRRWARVMYGVAILLPRVARPRWIGASLSATKAKELVRRLWRLVPRR